MTCKSKVRSEPTLALRVEFLAASMAEYLFNVDNGYLEGLVRGFRSGILSRTDYINLVQCETIEGKLLSLSVTLK